jgi:methyltransferase (TIGR00027 family)
VRVALWRALHVEIDPPPHVLEDEVGLRLAEPEAGWRQRPDMDPQGTRRFRAGIVARARVVEDLLQERLAQGVRQYVLLGAGLDTFAQRRPEVASQLRLFEVDEPETQAWKQQRLRALGFGIPEWLRFVPVNFEAGERWWEQLAQAGFRNDQPALVASLGVSLYLSREANSSLLRQVAALAPGSTLVSSFILPIELCEPEERPGREAAERGARARGTPFVCSFSPQEMLQLARDAGFRQVQHLSSAHLTQRYFSGRADGLRPGSEELIVASI